MPRPASNPADVPGRVATRALGTAWVAALIATGLAFALAIQALLAGNAAAPPPALPWLLAAGLACAAAAIGWTLWRQRALEIALRDARAAEPAIGVAPPPSPQAKPALPDPLLAGLPLPVIILEAAGREVGAVVQANAAAAQLSSRTPAQLEGLAWPDLRKILPDGAGDRAAQAFGETVEPVDAAWDAHAQRIEAGVPARALWVLSLTPTRAAAPAASDHESFSYTVSHDLRAPIRVVEGFTKILKEDYGRQLDRIGNDHLERVLGAAARMNSMIDALLTLSQLSSRPLARQPVNLSQLAGYVADDLRRQAPEREIDLHIEDGLQAQGDPTLLRVVLENLLGNAWKYTAKKPDAQIRFESAVNDGVPAYCVRDNGAGFDMRFADRLFGVFQRLHSANDFQGTGVGLASVRRIVRRHGGEIWAESEVQRGSSFYFTLPSGNAAP
ncbi:MAG: ATP-binding protein [Rhizobacter sp.]|nr:ATP-binding protein [Rhizobacter sp.]